MKLEAKSYQAANPIMVEVTRAGMVESLHRGRAVIVDYKGNVKKSWGDASAATYPRSCVKIFQLLPAFLSGAVDKAGFMPNEIALSCSSHLGEPMHCDCVEKMLAKVGLTPADLGCGIKAPYAESAMITLAAQGKSPNSLHNTCSGKHAALLAQAVQLGAPTKGYCDVTHPVQQAIFGTLERVFDMDLSDAPMGIDGCSIPTWAVPLTHLAYGFARFAEPKELPEDWQTAIKRMRSAIAANPLMVSGNDSYVSRLLATLGERIYIKDGAEGVMCAALPEYGLGVALKSDDGFARGAEMMLTSILEEIGIFEDLSKEAAEKIADLRHPNLYNANHIHIGVLQKSKDMN